MQDELNLRTTKEVLEHHNKYLQGGNLEETLKDYLPDSVIINMGGPVVGIDAIRAFFSDSIAHCLPPQTTYETLQCYVHGEMAYITWKAESPFYSVPYGTDTFFIQNGKIVRQTFAGILHPKQKAGDQA